MTRHGILRAAEDRFAAAGFAATTTREVAALAGVNVATLHYHFGSKEKLYRAVLDAVNREDVFHPSAAAAPAERLSGAVEALWDFGLAHPSSPRLRLFHRLDRSASPAGALDVPEDRRAAFLERTLTETDTKIPLAPAETARIILALLDSALVAAQDGRVAGNASGAEAARTLRRAVVAAVLRVAGVA
jgi:AcrR family transcriptional regulator